MDLEALVFVSEKFNFEFLEFPSTTNFVPSRLQSVVLYFPILGDSVMHNLNIRHLIHQKHHNLLISL